MTSKQRAHYFSRLWPAACQVQGWKVTDEAARRDVTRESTGRTSTSGLSQDEMVALMRSAEMAAVPSFYEGFCLPAVEAAVALAAITFGLVYTVHSERVNLARGAWAYAPAMPTLPWLGTGLAPVLQWLVVPAAALVWAAKATKRSASGGR